VSFTLFNADGGMPDSARTGGHIQYEYAHFRISFPRDIKYLMTAAFTGPFYRSGAAGIRAANIEFKIA